MLIWLILFLAVSFGSIVGAGAREDKLEPGELPTPRHILRARIFMLCTTVLLVVILDAGKW